MKKEQLKTYLDQKVTLYNNPRFIETDPIQVPHQFKQKEDIEIAAFLAATIAWGQRQTIIRNANKLIKLLDNQPFDFISNANEKDTKKLSYFVHRTFNGDDCIFFIQSLINIYKHQGGLETVFTEGFVSQKNIYGALAHFRNVFLYYPHLQRSEKHISNVQANASCKRLNMFLRWMVRNDNTGVDFGIWKQIPIKALMLPLDVHTGNVARELGILTRKQNDWQAVEEVTSVLREFCADDPVKYDFALFGIGAFENKLN